MKTTAGNGNFSVQLKPVGSSCNIKCSYCYVEPFKSHNIKVMDYQTLEHTIIKCLESSDAPTFSWHGGEPLLAGIDFLKKAMGLMKKHRRNKQRIRNMIQTNAMLIMPETAKFLKRHRFGVSVSLDGPENIHGKHRVDRSGKNTFDAVMRGISNLRDAKVQPSVICTVTQDTLPFAAEVFHFLVSIGFKKIKYSPVFDSTCDNFSISNDEWYSYLQTVFDEWFALEDPDIQVRELDEVILWLTGEKLSLCSSDQSCLSWISIDPDGNMYPCEYLRSKYSYGNIRHEDFLDIHKTSEYKGFCKTFKAIPPKCKKCEFHPFCGNGCPATRMANGIMSAKGVYVYCEERKMLYNAIKHAFEEALGHASQ